eukprot:6197601-Pleurochrysis_carterae.AAC.1
MNKEGLESTSPPSIIDIGMLTVPRGAETLNPLSRGYSSREAAATVTWRRREPRPCGRSYRERVGASVREHNGMK